MISHLQFPCKIAQKCSNLKLTQQSLELSTAYTSITFLLSLDLIIAWVFFGDKITGFQIESLQIEGEWGDMRCLEQHLRHKVTFTRITLFYTFKEELANNNASRTKVCKVISNYNLQTFACKVYDKQFRSRTKIHHEIRVLQKLQGLPFIPNIFEVFESSKRVYLIQEYFPKKFDEEFTEEEIKIVVYVNLKLQKNLLLSVFSLENHSVAHKNIKRKHILFDENNVVKLVGFGSAVYENVSNHEYRLDIFDIGILLFKQYLIHLNSYQPFTQKDEMPTIPDHGTDFLCLLLNEPYECSFNFEQAFSHPYLQSLLGEGMSEGKYQCNIEIKSMDPKFKSEIDNKNFQPQSLTQTIIMKKLLQQDPSTIFKD